MKLTRFLLTIVCVLGMLSVFSQPDLSAADLRTVKIDALSDSEIQGYYNKAITSGATEDQLYQLAQQRGLPPEEIVKLRQRVAFLNAGSRKTVAGNVTTDNSGVDRKMNAGTDAVPMQSVKKDAAIFGAELFSVNSSTFEPSLRISTPTNYIVGPDDELIINVYGYSEQTYSLTVNAEGNIYIPNVGPLYVSGLSIEQASAKIKAKLAATIYRNINSGATNVQLSLGKIRSIHATVIGEATKPGTYTVSSLTTLFNLLYLCGGPSDMGSYRNIELIRGNQVHKKIDLYGFLVSGNMQDNVLLQEGDIIRIPYYITRVTLSGYVKRQGKFELQKGETFSQLLNYAGGFTDNAYQAGVQVRQLTDKEQKITDIPASAFDQYKPSGSDYFTIGQVLDRFVNRVSIAGAVRRPGEFELENNMTLSMLIDKAGGLREDAYLDRGIISRLNSDLTPASVSFNVKDVILGGASIPLKREDIVSIASISGLKDNYNVNIEGEVHAPGQFGWRENLTVKDVIFLAGGFTDYANPRSIEISRRVKNANVGEKQYQQAELIKLDLKDGTLSGADADVHLQPSDIVMVRALSGYVQQRSVFVVGQIMNPGRYVMETNTERIASMVKRFGGFRNAADSNFIVVRRITKLGLSADDKRVLFERLLNINNDSLNNNSRLKEEIYRNFDLISIDLKKAIKEENSSDNIMLEDGDFITVERASNLIKVSGEVYYPTVVPYEEGKSMKYYVNRSGSFTDNARKKGSMIIYPDGRAKSIGKFLFFNNYPSVIPRSEIFVPAKSKSNRNRLSTGEWVAISSIFATLGTLIITAFRK